MGSEEGMRKKRVHWGWNNLILPTQCGWRFRGFLFRKLALGWLTAVSLSVARKEWE